MKRLRLSVLLFFAVFCLLIPQANASTYTLDDGSGESALGGMPEGTTMIWMNQFNAVGETVKITSIEVAWGPVADGTAATVFLWSDPNGDGNPTDREVLSSLSVAVTNNDTDIFNLYDIADADVTGSFFVGVEMVSPESKSWPMRLDKSDPSGKSWTVIGTAAPVHIGVDTTYNGDFMIRANGTTVTEAPEPATMLLLGLGLMGLAGVRRNFKK